MTLVVFRLGKKRHAKQNFSGIGGLHAHGSWTWRGRPVVYTSGSISLAILEYTANYRRLGWVPAMVLARAVIPDDLPIETVKLTDLPPDWAEPDPPEKLREFGRNWLERGGAVALLVPSAIVKQEWNYLLNPAHPDFTKLTLEEPEEFEVDRRLARTRRS